MNAAGAGRTVALAVDDTAISLDLDFQDGGVVGARKRSEGLTAALTAALVVGQGAGLVVGRQVGIIASAVAGGAALLAAWASRWFCLSYRGHSRGQRRRISGRRRVLGLWIVGGQGILGIVDLRTASEESVSEVAVFGQQMCELQFKFLFPLSGALVEGLVRGGLLSCIDEL